MAKLEIVINLFKDAYEHKANEAAAAAASRVNASGGGGSPTSSPRAGAGADASTGAGAGEEEPTAAGNKTPSTGTGIGAAAAAPVGLQPEWLFKYAMDVFALKHDYTDELLGDELLRGMLLEMADYLDAPLKYEVDHRVLIWPLYFFVVANIAKVLTKFAVWGIEDYQDSLYVNYEKCKDIQTQNHTARLITGQMSGGTMPLNTTAAAEVYARSYTLVKDGNPTACYLFLALVLPLHGIPVFLFFLELFFPTWFPRRFHNFVWTMKALYRSSYGDIWRPGACMWLISLWTPVGIALQLFLPGHQISNDESSLNGTTTCYYVMVSIMLISGSLSSMKLTEGGRLAYARERYYLSSSTPVEVPYKTNVTTGEDVYLEFQKQYTALLISKKREPKGVVMVFLRGTLGVLWERLTNLKPTSRFLWFLVPAVIFASLPIGYIEPRFCWGILDLDWALNQLCGWPAGFAVYFFQFEIAKISNWYYLRVQMMTMMRDCISHEAARNSLNVPRGNGVPFIPLQSKSNLSSWLTMRVFMQRYFESENIARSEVAIAGILVIEIVTMILFIWCALYKYKSELFYSTFLLALNTMYITAPIYSAVLINEQQVEQRNALMDRTFTMHFNALVARAEDESDRERLELVIRTSEYLANRDKIMRVLMIPMTKTSFLLLRSYIIAGLLGGIGLLADWNAVTAAI